MVRLILTSFMICLVNCLPNSFADRLHLLIPAGPGGGLDSTARALGESLMQMNTKKVVSEMLRVLKPGGELYCSIPFIFGFHASPHDYQRYTVEGFKF